MTDFHRTRILLFTSLVTIFLVLTVSYNLIRRLYKLANEALDYQNLKQIVKENYRVAL